MALTRRPVLSCVLLACTRLSACVAALILVAAAGVRAEDDFLAVNVDREKQLIEGHVREFRDLLDANKLQESRATLRLVEDRLAAIKKQLPRADRQGYDTRVAALTKVMRQKEDSLVAEARNKLATEGVDATIDYAQQVLRRIGLPEERFQEIDKLLMEEAPKLQAKKEAEAMARATKALEQGQPVPEDVDPYLAMTARQLVQAKRDSVRAVKEQDRLEKTSRGKKSPARNSRKEPSEPPADVSSAESWPEQSQEVQLADTERKQREQDSVASALRTQREELDKQRKEHERQLREEEAQLNEADRKQRQEQRALAADVERQREAEQRAIDEQRRREERQKQQPVVEPEQPATPAVYHQPVSDWTAQTDTSKLREQSERERQRRIDDARREEERAAAIEKLNKGDSPFHESAQGSGQSASVREYMKLRKDDEKKAQTESVQIYELIEKKKPSEALVLFKSRREFLAQYLTREVFVILERSVGVAAGKAAMAGDTAGPAISPRELPKEEQHVMRIHAYLSERRWSPAISLFDQQKKALKQYMAKEEFNKLKSMVDSARKFETK